MDEFDFSDWDEFESQQAFLLYACRELSKRVFIADEHYAPEAMDDYNLGYLDAADWWPLAVQLDEIMDLEGLIAVLTEIDATLQFPGVPSELLENPLGFLSAALGGYLPPERSGRQVGSRKLVKLARQMVDLLRFFGDDAQAAIRAWASVHRHERTWIDDALLEDDDLLDLLLDGELPPAMTGFGMVLSLSLMQWPDRAEGMPPPPDLLEPDLYDDLLSQWEQLPDGPGLTETGGEAEALFAQGQLAHVLAQMGAAELMSSDGPEEQDLSLSYSRLSRAVLWVHNQCRRCPERDGVACRAATGFDERPAPLVDLSAEIADTGRIEGCVRM